MYKLSTYLSCIFFCCSISAQVWENNLLKTNKNPSFLEKYEAFEDYRKLHPYKKGNGYKPYAREMDFITKRVAENSIFKPNALYIEWLQKKEKNLYTQASNSNWLSLGPINTPIILSNGKKRGNGRINCIAFDPINANIIWVGSPSGGLWKSNDGGSNWVTNTDNLPVMGVSHIAIDPQNNQTMYIVTGDAYASDTYSIGILKSVDGGVSWNTTGLSYTINQQETVNKIIINPNFSDSLYAVTNSNIMISVDGGVLWESIGPSGRWRDIEFKPDNANVLYAAKQSTSGASAIYRSLDGGGSWDNINIGMSGNKYRPLLAVTIANPEVVYALFSASDDSFHGLYKSNNSGDSWILQSDSPNILGRDTDGSGSGGQSWYDLSLGVSKNNENLVYVGGINLWKSNNGGINWNIDASSGGENNYSYMHVDQHALEFNPHTNIAYAGNDGGIYKYMDTLNKWINISDGLEISQFYNIGLSQSNNSRLVAGAQDNGTEMLTNTTWNAIMGGDGMECAIDHYDEDIIYAEFQYGGLRKSYNGGEDWDDIKPVSYEGAWNTPYKMHKTNNNLIVIGYDEIYRSTTGGAIWDSISNNIIGGKFRSLALAPSNEDYIYAASYGKIVVTKDAGLNWTNIKPGLPYFNITSIAVSSNNAEKAWVTFSDYNNTDKVYETIDGGNNWENITGNNLPQLPVNCIVHQDGANDALYIGTDVGVYYKNNTMSDWVSFNNGLPNVIVQELEIHYNKGTICAATFGRGVWESPLNTPTNVSTKESKSIDFIVSPNPTRKHINVATKFKGVVTINIFSISGQKVIQTQSKDIDVSTLTKGWYIIEIESNIGVNRKKLAII